MTTKREFERQMRQNDTLRQLGFTQHEADQLRRISMTLQRWHELECGDSNEYASWCIARGEWGPRNTEGKREFVHNEDGKPFMERHSHTESKARYFSIPDRETGAKKRLAAILNSCNMARAGFAKARPLGYYIQTDPRGAALYIIRPGDVPAGADVGSYYSRGICVY